MNVVLKKILPTAIDKFKYLMSFLLGNVNEYYGILDDLVIVLIIIQPWHQCIFVAS